MASCAGYNGRRKRDFGAVEINGDDVEVVASRLGILPNEVSLLIQSCLTKYQRAVEELNLADSCKQLQDDSKGASGEAG